MSTNGITNDKVACTKCGSFISPSDEFCAYCGTKQHLTEKAPTASSGKWFTQAGSLDDSEDVEQVVKRPEPVEAPKIKPPVASTVTYIKPVKGIKPSSPVPEQGDSRSTVPVGFDSVPVEVPAAPGNVIPVQNDTPDAPNKVSPKPVAPVPPTVPVSKPDVPVAPNKKECKCKKCGAVIPEGTSLCWKCSTSAKKPKKKWVAVGIIAAVLVCIIAVIIPLVLRNAPVSESQIKDDMRSAMSRYLDDSFSLDGITITKRQTDTSDKTDTVYLEWTAHNNVCSVENEAVMTYQLYNDGWMFEDINSHRTTTTITASDVSPESARAEAESSYIPQKYEGGDWVEVARETDLASGEDVFVYNYKIYFYYCTRTYTAHVKYKFYNTGWYYDSVEWDDGVSDWDIDGEWTCRTKDAQVWIKIHSFEDRQGTLEYSVKFDYQGWYYYGVQSFYTDEPVSVYGSEHTDTDRIEYLQIDLPDRNASSEHAEAGYLKLYPSAMYWNSLHAKDNVYKLEPSDGGLSVKLSELFMTEDERYSHWSLEYTDPNGNTYDEFYEYSSYDSMWDSNFEGYTFYELDKPYSTITGTYFCSPKMPNDVGISFYIYADDVCIYKDEHLHVGDGVHNFNVDISGKSTLKIMVVCDDKDYYCGTDDPRPTIILVDTYLN